jgi:hypothetical protein
MVKNIGNNEVNKLVKEMSFLNIHKYVDKFLSLSQADNDMDLEFPLRFFDQKSLLLRKKIPRY